MRNSALYLGFAALLFVCLIIGPAALAADTKTSVKTETSAVATSAAVSDPTVKDPVDTPVTNAAMQTAQTQKVETPMWVYPYINAIKIGPCWVGDTDSYGSSTDDLPNKPGFIGIVCQNPIQTISKVNGVVLSNFANTTSKLYLLPSQQSWPLSTLTAPDVLQTENAMFYNTDWTDSNGNNHHENARAIPVNKIAGAVINTVHGSINALYMNATDGLDTTSPLRFGTYGLHTGVIELVVGPRTGFLPAITVTTNNNITYTLVSYRKAACPVYAPNNRYVVKPVIDKQEMSMKFEAVGIWMSPYSIWGGDYPHAGYACAPDNS